MTDKINKIKQYLKTLFVNLMPYNFTEYLHEISVRH